MWGFVGVCVLACVRGEGVRVGCVCVCVGVCGVYLCVASSRYKTDLIIKSHKIEILNLNRIYKT